MTPIALFTYNRPSHLQRTVQALRDNTLASASDLFIFSDGAKDPENTELVAEVRKYIKTITGFKSLYIVEAKDNQGLANSIIAGVTKIVADFGKVIVLEDDMVTSPYFLKYMNDALDLYEAEERVASIHGYVYPIKNLPETFFIKGADCWGWGTWKRAWDLFEPDGKKILQRLRERGLTSEFDFNDSYPYTAMLEGYISGKNDSWAIRWYASAFLADKLTLYPGHSLLQNIGNDSSGTHSGTTSVFDVSLASQPIHLEKISPDENLLARKAFTRYFTSMKPNIAARVFRKIKRMLKA